MLKASLYQRANTLQRRDAEEIIKEFESKFKWRQNGEDTLIDVGCGSGDVTIDFILPILPNNFGKLVGTDLSENMVKYAKNTYEYINPGIHFEVLDISADLSLKITETYDHLTSFYCLHWIQDQRQAVKNMFDLLNPGGDVLVMFLARNPIFEIYEILSKNPKWSNYMIDVSRFTSPYQHAKHPEKEFQKHLEEVGFKNCQVETREKIFVYENFDIVQKSVRAINPFEERIPKCLLEEFYEDYFNVVRKLNLMEDSNNNNEDIKNIKIVNPYTLLVAYGRK